MLKLSVITINLNNLPGLNRTMDSVFQQSWKDFEYIIMDGGSTDGSRELIEENARKLSYWVSEKDKGIYCAMNSGIEQAKGEYLLFLNSGDELADDAVLKNIVPFLSGEDLVYGNIIFVKPDDTTYNSSFPPKLSFDFFADFTLAHPGTFIKTEVIKRLGLYDESLKICADWKFFMEAVFKENVSYKMVDQIISKFYLDGISSQDAFQMIIKKERDGVLLKEYPAFWEMYRELKQLRQLKNSWVVRSSLKAGLIKRN
jgi:glycosyltransferase involved in cell wall biosynthesis